MITSQLISRIVERLQPIPGIQAIVLGGSRARGTHTPTSDIDLGIYYQPTAPLDLAALADVATSIDDEQRTELVTEIGGWGPWINGGGWLRVQGIPVDFLYRDLDQVARIIADCQAGQFEIAYQPGHPHGFASHIYLAEIALCQPLYDPQQTIARLKAETQPYPIALKHAIIRRFAWEAEFSLLNAHKSVSRSDVAYAAGCCFRCVACLAQTLFALNERPWMNEKGAVAIATTFPLCPPNFQPRVEDAFGRLNTTAEAIAGAIATLERLVQETQALVGEMR
ncbi:MAG: nucleotidyltransferase domain-containing protein [Chloroflexi bacterium]|nr:nucleotidyltransferase domain-containing protein [Chloroflexota bacterium]